MMARKENKISVLILVLAAIVAIGTFVMCNGLVSGYRSSLTEQETEIVTLQNQVTLAKAEVESRQNSVVLETTGLDLERKYRDDDIFRSFASKVTTFATYEEYNAMRKEIIKEYREESGNRSLSRFLPDRPYGYDGGMVEVSSEYNRFESMCLSIDEETDTYSYSAMVTCVTSGKFGGREEVTSVFLYDITEDGTLKHVQAYTLIL